MSVDVWVPTYDERAAALLAHLHAEGETDIGIDDLSPGYGETRIDVLSGRDDWIVATESEADDMAREYIIDSAWAFASWFLADYMPDDIYAEDIDSIRGDRCEDANGEILALIRAGAGIDEFVSDAIATDGRGNFLSFYDGEEIEFMAEAGPLYLYQS